MNEGQQQAAPAAAPQTSAAPTPAPGYAPPVAGQAGVTPLNSSDWMSSFNDELKGYAQTKGFKEPGAVLESYRNMEKLLGAPREQLLRLPQKEDDPGWGEIYDRLGRPKDPNGYDIKLPENQVDKEFLGWAKNVFHEIGLQNRQASALASKWNEYIQSNAQKQQEQVAARGQAATEQLKQEWGAAYQKNATLVDNAAVKLGLQEKQLVALREALGPSEAMKFVYSIASQLGEDRFVSNQEHKPGFGGVMTPQEAQSRIAVLKGDHDFVRKYTAGDASAKSEMERLHKYAYGVE